MMEFEGLPFKQSLDRLVKEWSYDQAHYLREYSITLIDSLIEESPSISDNAKELDKGLWNKFLFDEISEMLQNTSPKFNIISFATTMIDTGHTELETYNEAELRNFLDLAASYQLKHLEDDINFIERRNAYPELYLPASEESLAHGLHEVERVKQFQTKLRERVQPGQSGERK